jgi:Coenzyme PQQ synthesis protein D (PqqD)
MYGQVITRSVNVVSRVVADEAIVVPIRRGAVDMDAIYTFNGSGTALWKMIEENRSAAEMAEYLQREYNLTAERAIADAAGFIEELAAAGLIDRR